MIKVITNQPILFEEKGRLGLSKALKGTQYESQW